MASKPILGYWDIRGLGHPIRMLLTYVGVDFVDKRYQIGPGPEFDRSDWLNEKFNLGLDFPNLPYYIEGDIKLTQSIAILRYLGRKYNLDGQNEQEWRRIALCEQQIVDLFWAMARIFYDPNFEKLKLDLFAKLPDDLKFLTEFLGDHPFVAGTNLSYIDFLVYEYFVRVKLFAPEIFAKFPSMNSFINRFESIPKISAFIKQQEPQFLNARLAQWNVKY
ncbi:Sar s 8 allergen (glutathione S transferase mu-like protein 3) [Sarcoptes scabiei]|uniref:Glutathione S-transferase n=1 Tax=Sarcoptes scabiei TaxID=52283 RepID=A0A132ALW8_SARSC|nr:Sar s 8 allergen (glutathione S transferase mu-like protein 3) [Sarcoptes scabiei]